MRRLTTFLAGAVAAAAVFTTATPAQAQVLPGEIGYRYWLMGESSSVLGRPVSPEIRTPNNKGAYVLFQNGAIYWSPWTGAHEIYGEIRNGWGRLGWENGYLGFPTDGEEQTLSRRGAYQDFEGGTMYWAPWTGAHAVKGAIKESYEDIYCSYECVWAEDALGFPTTSEIRTPNGRGAYNHFQFGSIYWSPGTGAHPVYGGIRDAWARQGWENGRLGFPIDEERFDYEYGVPYQEFEHGAIIWWHGWAEIFYY